MRPELPGFDIRPVELVLAILFSLHHFVRSFYSCDINDLRYLSLPVSHLFDPFSNFWRKECFIDIGYFCYRGRTVVQASSNIRIQIDEHYFLTHQRAKVATIAAKMLAAHLDTESIKEVEKNAELVEWVRPDAGGMCCVRLKMSAYDDAGVEAFYRTAAQRQITVAAGDRFLDERRVFRLGFGALPLDTFERALDALGDTCRGALNGG